MSDKKKDDPKEGVPFSIEETSTLVSITAKYFI